MTPKRRGTINTAREESGGTVVATVINLTVHGIGPTVRALDPGEDGTWVSVEQFEQVIDSVVGRPDVRLTFDDGNASDIEIALPRLVERGLIAEFFVLAGRLGEAGRLTADQVGELIEAGMLVGSHGWAHRDWRRIAAEQATKEIHDAPRVLAELTGRRVSRVAVPFGSYDRHVLARLRRAGMTRAYTSDGGRCRPDAWLQPRNSLHHGIGPDWANQLLDGTPSLRRRARAVAATAVKRTRGAPRDAETAVAPDTSAGRDAPARVAVVIVTYNSADVLRGCLESVDAGAKGVDLGDVVVVDNASRDDSLRIADEFDGLSVRTVQTGRNAGYAAGVNAGVAALDLGTLDAVMVLNPDCRLAPGALAVLADRLGSRGAGTAVPKLVNPDGSLQPSIRSMPTVRRALAEALLGQFAGRIGRIGEFVTNPAYYERAGEWAWATGAAMLLSTDMITDLGPWDESFLLYSEETEYALRAADHGWTLWYEPAAIVEHIGGEAHLNATYAALLVTNRVDLFRRRRGAFPGAAYYLATLLGEALRAAAGRRTSRAVVAALLRPSRRLRELPS
jgi:N-acetylglucosaminyl-diphospho-decaprenol L-rhamnosyltransferase